MPIRYHVNTAGAPDTEADVLARIAEAAALWEAVPCADVRFEFAGTTEARFAEDGQNVIYWVNDVWQEATPNAAAATLWLNQVDPGAPLEVDLALNNVDFDWVVGGGDALVSDVVDPVSVIAHELGHWLGLAHASDQFATMYQAMLPNAVQATLEADDKWGACNVYPTGVNECATDDDCGPTRRCDASGGPAVCTDRHAPTGDSCSKDDLNCAGMCFISLYECSSLCAFQNVSYTQGYCAPLCVDAPCPPGWVCTDLEQVGSKVCLQQAAAADANDTTPATIDPLPAMDSSMQHGGCGAVTVSPLLLVPALFKRRRLWHLRTHGRNP